MHLHCSDEEFFNALFAMEIEPGESNLGPGPDLSNVEEDMDTDAVVEHSEKCPITFLDLPENVKIRILQYAGLLRPCLINVAFEKFRAKQDRGMCGMGNPVRMTRLSWSATWVDPYHGPCDHPRLPVELFLTSRRVRDELRHIFFSRNRFSIHFYSRSEYKIFRAATDWGLHHLRHLHIDLGPRENRFLKLGGGIHRTTMSMWTSFCHRSVDRMPALECFSMRCRVKDLEVAYKLMCAMDPFPVLTHCAFHLSHLQDDDIRPVIKRASWRLIGNLDDRPPFPFLRLPKEVQLLVLEHLLINRYDPWLPISERSPGIVTFQDRKRLRITSHPLVCCGTCSTLRAMCFCPARQTAFSTSCTCFTSPIPYFLVNHGFYEDCRRVFFSKNNFAFVEEDPDSIMRFMHCIPTLSFMQIRHLSFKFPFSYRLFPKSGRSEESALLSWSVLRRFIREHFDLPRLSLTIVDFGTKNTVSHRTKYMRKMLKAFVDLRGLRDFRIYLADDRAFEKELERAVLGAAGDGRLRSSRLPFIRNEHP